MTLDKLSLAAAMALSDIDHFSRLVIQVPLYDYQVKPMQAVAGSILGRQGKEFLLVFPRQSGKNEAVAQLLVYLMNLLQRRGGNIVYGATGDGLGRGIQRLERRLDNPWNKGRWKKAARPARRILGQASVVFLSSHPSASARGETADWLLVVDEMQDQQANHLEAVFEPMRAANNATALYIGTVRTKADALWQKKEQLERLPREKGYCPVFVVSPQVVIEARPDYGRFLENKINHLGRQHPIIASEYFNEPLEDRGRLFDDRRLSLMRGTHTRQRSAVSSQQSAGSRQRSADSDQQSADSRQRSADSDQRSANSERRSEKQATPSPAHSHTPTPLHSHAPTIHIATLDVGGQDEAATNYLARLANPGRDYTVAHVFEVKMPGQNEPGPTYRAIAVFVDQGSRHFQTKPGRVSLAKRLFDWLEAWGVSHLVADESGVGAGLVDWLSARLGPQKVTGFTFTAGNKATLGVDFLSLVETGRFKYWCREGEGAGLSPPYSDGWWFFQQVEACTYSLPAGGRLERELRWGVLTHKRIDTPEGNVLVHDDRLISAALVSVYDDLISKGKLRLGQGNSAIIPPYDPLQDTHF